MQGYGRIFSSYSGFQLTRHSKVYENPSSFHVSKIFQDKFYGKLAQKYIDLPIWSNLDREHLFLYIAHYKRSFNEVADLSILIRNIQNRKKTAQRSMKKNDLHPVLNDGIFIGTFNFNLAQIIHSGLSGKTARNIRKEKVNVLLDIENNRIFTISELAKDIISRSHGESSISEIIDLIKEKYQIPYDEAKSKCESFLNGLIEKNILSNLR